MDAGSALQDYQSWVGQWESGLPTNEAFARFILGNVDVPGVTTAEDNLNVLATTLPAYLAFQADTGLEIPDAMDGLDALAKDLDHAKIGYPSFA